MSGVVSLKTARMEREVGAVDGILADINRHVTLPAMREALGRPAVQRPGAEQRSDLFRVYRWPPPWRVAFIVREKGSAAAQERWHWISERELRSLAARGGASFLVEGDEA